MVNNSSSEEYSLNEQNIDTTGNISTNSIYLTKFEFNVIHPLSQKNMIFEPFSERRILKIIKAFRIGAANLTVEIKKPSTNIQAMSSSVRSFFPAVTARFSDSWRPDALGNTVETHMQANYNLRNLMIGDVMRMTENIAYFDLVLESIVSESALITMATEVLTEKGPLPVSEIGKILAEWTSFNALTQKLKESHGGLKNFLEQYPEIFFSS
jgi:hypothetical protein